MHTARRAILEHTPSMTHEPLVYQQWRHLVHTSVAIGLAIGLGIWLDYMIENSLLFNTIQFGFEKKHDKDARPQCNEKA